MQMKEFTEFIYILAEKSGDVIRPYFAQANLDVEVKDDQTPVTRADREAEAAMRALIQKTYPHHGILGEEFGPECLSGICLDTGSHRWDHLIRQRMPPIRNSDRPP